MEGSAHGSSLSRVLTEVEDFGPNPGNLRMLVYKPQPSRKHPALVVVLHGCTQTAQGYDVGSGWSALADRGGFMLLYAEQKKANNARLCFNWFNPEDVKRGHGEVASIREMIATAIKLHGIDQSNVFVTGLSAGGAMTGAMLATYPETFKAGAIIAGLPFGAATSTSEALDCMFTGKLRPPRHWGDLVRSASAWSGPWPAVSVWYGMSDTTVKPINAGEIIKQWTNVQGLSDANPEETAIGVITRRLWRDPRGKPRVTEYAIPNLGHGTPVDGRGGVDDGVLGPFFLASGLWSSLKIAQDWGLLDTKGKARKTYGFSLLGFRF